MLVADTIRDRLSDKLAPRRLRVDDDSHQHVGHAGARPGGQTHYSVEVVSESFAGMTRVARHRLVYDILSDLLADTVHALQLRALTPDEDTRAEID